MVLHQLQGYVLLAMTALTAVMFERPTPINPPVNVHGLGRTNQTYENGQEGHPYHNPRFSPWENKNLINATGNGHSIIYQSSPEIIPNHRDNEGVRAVSFFSHGWIFDCLSVTSGIMQSSTNGYRDQLAQIVQNSDKETATELRKLHGTLRDLQMEVDKLKQIASQSSSKVSSRPQISSLWAGLNPYSGDNHGWITAHIVMWWIVTSLILFYFYGLIQKRSPPPEKDDRHSSSQIQKELRELKLEIANLTKMISTGGKSDTPISPSFSQSKTVISPNISPPIPKSRAPTSSSSSSSHSFIQGNGLNNEKDTTDVLADVRAKLAKETADVRKAQQEHYAKLREEKARKYEEERKERESKFKTVMGEKIRLEKEELLQWATIPD